MLYVSPWQLTCSASLMKTLTLMLLVVASVPVFSQSDNPAKALFDAGIRDEQAGKLDRAKLTFLTLAGTYAGHPLTTKAKAEIGAIYLFKEAQSQVQAGKPAMRMAPSEH